MNYKQINELIQETLREVYHRDSLLLERRVREECVNHRVAFYFEILYGTIVHDDMYYSVDLEYNKNLSNRNKDIESDGIAILSIRPDIIIHKRDNNNNNILAVEAKLFRLTLRDILKLKKLLFPPYSYKFTSGIVYNPTKNYFSYSIFRLENEKIILDQYKILK